MRRAPRPRDSKRKWPTPPPTVARRGQDRMHSSPALYETERQIIKKVMLITIEERHHEIRTSCAGRKKEKGKRKKKVNVPPQAPRMDSRKRDPFGPHREILSLSSIPRQRRFLFPSCTKAAMRAELMEDRMSTISKVLTRDAHLTKNWAVAKEMEDVTISRAPWSHTQPKGDKGTDAGVEVDVDVEVEGEVEGRSVDGEGRVYAGDGGGEGEPCGSAGWDDEERSAARSSSTPSPARFPTYSSGSCPSSTCISIQLDIRPPRR